MNASDATSSKSATAPAEAPAEPRANGGSCSSTARRYRLDGPSVALDPRVNAYRDDLADINLAGRIIAPHYARPMPRPAVAAAVVRLSPAADAEQVAALEPGEHFAVLEFAGGWAWGFVESGHLVGYVPADALGDGASAPEA